MNIIFLDIDGPLTTMETYKLPTNNRGNAPFDYNAVQHLNHLIKESDAKIVISSSWRVFHSFDDLKKIFKEEGVKGEIMDIVPITSESRDRGVQIREWLEGTSITNIRFVIIDDDIEDIKSYFPRKLVHTNGKHGITGMQVSLARAILEKQEVYHVSRTS